MEVLKVKDWLIKDHAIVVSEDRGPLHAFKVPKHIKDFQSIYESEEYKKFRQNHYTRNKVERDASDKILNRTILLGPIIGTATSSPSIIDFLKETYEEVSLESLGIK